MKNNWKNPLLNRFSSMLTKVSKKSSPKVKRWWLYSFDKAEINLVTRDLAHHLVSSIYPEELEIFEMVADQTLNQDNLDVKVEKEKMKVLGLPMGNLASLSSIRALTLANIVISEVIQLAQDLEVYPGIAIRQFRENKDAQKKVILKAQDLGFDLKTARNLLNETLESIGPEFHFILDQPVAMEEDRDCEFKNVNIKHIPKETYEFVIAFLNSRGGRIYFGIQNEDRVVKGIDIGFRDRDKLIKSINVELFKIRPVVSPGAAYRMMFHEVYIGDVPQEDKFVLEIIVFSPESNFLYRSESGKVYLKTDSGRKELSEEEKDLEIARRSK